MASTLHILYYGMCRRTSFQRWLVLSIALNVARVLGPDLRMPRPPPPYLNTRVENHLITSEQPPCTNWQLGW
ncbi:hypothetical protein BR93DRAFT_632209 [Coniochaeta sp. PMI_546]|nr:hypothetical protein BR93DRAFT_632209 [Coniochaeta sp. PMI_546]